MKQRRAFFFAAWYLWFGLGVPFPAPDPVPSAEAAVLAEFPCAGHACGCGTAEDCRRRCCCFPNNPQRASPEKGAVSFRSAMSCQGQETGGPVVSSSTVGAHLPVEVAALERDASPNPVPLSASFSRRAVPADPPDKIPVA